MIKKEVIAVPYSTPRCGVCKVLQSPDLLRECKPCLEVSELVRYDIFYNLPECCPVLRVYDILYEKGPISYDRLLEEFVTSMIVEDTAYKKVKPSDKEVRALDIILEILLEMGLIYEPRTGIYELV